MVQLELKAKVFKMMDNGVLADVVMRYNGRRYVRLEQSELKPNTLRNCDDSAARAQEEECRCGCDSDDDSTMSGLDDDDRNISMFLPSGYEKPIEESVDYGEEGDLICNMAGNAWESLPYPIIIDSGAAASVLPEK